MAVVLFFAVAESGAFFELGSKLIEDEGGGGWVFAHEGDR